MAGDGKVTSTVGPLVGTNEIDAVEPASGSLYSTLSGELCKLEAVGVINSGATVAALAGAVANARQITAPIAHMGTGSVSLRGAIQRPSRWAALSSLRTLRPVIGDLSADRAAI